MANSNNSNIDRAKRRLKRFAGDVKKTASEAKKTVRQAAKEVKKTVNNTAAKGKEDNVNFIMGKHALLCYSNPTPALKKPSAGYIFAWTGLEGSGAYGNRIVRLPMDMLGLGTERIEGEAAFDCKQIAADLGVFFKNIVQ